MQAIDGLNNFKGGLITSTQDLPGPGGTLTSATPGDITSAFHINQLLSDGYNGLGFTAAVIGFPEESFHTSDVNYFWHYYDIGYIDSAYNWLYPYVAKKIIGGGGTAGFDSTYRSNSKEETLDTEWLGVIAPAANIVVVVYNTGFGNPCTSGICGLNSEVKYAVNTLKANVINFGVEAGYGQGDATQMHDYMVQAADQGETVLAASGDYGYNVNNGNDVFPALDPYAIAVGGLNIEFSNGGISGYTGWSYGDVSWANYYYASGGGYVTTVSYDTQPSYQSGVAPNNGYRDIPDVSFPAAPQIAVYFNDKLTYGAGTSFATPMLAGVIADLDSYEGSQYGYINPSIYSVGPLYNGAVVDVTSGYNGQYAGTGWDFVTGIGAVKAYTFVQEVYSYYACNCH